MTWIKASEQLPEGAWFHAKIAGEPVMIKSFEKWLDVSYPTGRRDTYHIGSDWMRHIEWLDESEVQNKQAQEK